MEKQPGKYPKPSKKRQLLLWDVLRRPTAPARDSTSSLVPRQTALHHAKCLPGCPVRSLGQQRDLACLSPTQQAGRRR